MPPKRPPTESDSESEEDDYYSNLVQRQGVEIDESLFPSSASTSRNTRVRKEPEELSFLEEDDSMDLEKSMTFEEEMRMNVRRAERDKKKKLEMELKKIEDMARVTDADLGEKPRNIHYLPAYEDCVQYSAEINQLIRSSNSRRTEPEEEESKPLPQTKTTVLLHVVFIDDEQKERSKTFEWQPKRRFLDLLKEWAEENDCNVEQMKIMWEGDSVSSWRTPHDVGMEPGKTYDLEVVSFGGNTVSKPTIKFQLKDEKPILLTVHRDTTFSKIRKMILDQGVVFERMVFDGEALRNNETPHSAGIEHEDCVDLM